MYTIPSLSTVALQIINPLSANDNPTVQEGSLSLTIVSNVSINAVTTDAFDECITNSTNNNNNNNNDMNE
jgi:hypothetical protein